MENLWQNTSSDLWKLQFENRDSQQLQTNLKLNYNILLLKAKITFGKFSELEIYCKHRSIRKCCIDAKNQQQDEVIQN